MGWACSSVLLWAQNIGQQLVDSRVSDRRKLNCRYAVSLVFDGGFQKVQGALSDGLGRASFRETCTSGIAKL